MELVPLQSVYVTANFKETQTERMRAGQRASIEVDAMPGHALTGTVDSFAPGSGSQFALLPFEPGTGNFTKVVQRVPVRIQIEKDDRWPLLRAGLSLRLAIAHGPGDQAWADGAAREMIELETRYNQSRD
jgi:membrane fusion protein (multidrug efflux system)